MKLNLNDYFNFLVKIGILINTRKYINFYLIKNIHIFILYLNFLCKFETIFSLKFKHVHINIHIHNYKTYIN